MVHVFGELQPWPIPSVKQKSKIQVTQQRHESRCFIWVYVSKLEGPKGVFSCPLKDILGPLIPIYEFVG